MSWQVLQGDCLKLMRDFAPGSFDAVITDPPYGIGINKSNRLSVSRGFGGETWDDKPASAEAISLIRTLAPVQVIWGGNYFDLPPTRCYLVWDKLNSGRDFADCEMAWTNRDAVARLFHFRPMNMDGGKVHPTQKPLALMRWCIENFTVPGQRVLDPFCGSGTTGVACAELGRNFVGIEIDPGYADIARKRIEAASRQQRIPL